MKKGEFIRTSKRMVKEYYNRYIAKDYMRKIMVGDIEVIDFVDDKNNYRIILSTLTWDNRFYGVTYNKHSKELHSYIYESDDFRVIGKEIKE